MYLRNRILGELSIQPDAKGTVHMRVATHVAVAHALLDTRHQNVVEHV